MEIFAHLVSGSSWTGAMAIICEASSSSLLKPFVWTIESMTEDEPGRGTVVGCKLTLAQRHSVAGNIEINQSSTDCKRSGSMFSYHRRHLRWDFDGERMPGVLASSLSPKSCYAHPGQRHVNR